MEPITTELRVLLSAKPKGDPCWDAMDAIDAVHAGLERENAALRAKVEELDNVGGSMHDGGSITDGLREWAYEHLYKSGIKSDLLAIADRIDAEHEHEMEERADRYSELRARMNNCYIELPKDADGEHIHEHDKVDWRDHAGTWHENATVVAVCNDGCYVVDGAVFHVHKSDIRHHHAPTVKDVLHKLVGRARALDCAEDEYALVDEYAQMLRLAKGGDE